MTSFSIRKKQLGTSLFLTLSWLLKFTSNFRFCLFWLLACRNHSKDVEFEQTTRFKSLLARRVEDISLWQLLSRHISASNESWRSSSIWRNFTFVRAVFSLSHLIMNMKMMNERYECYSHQSVSILLIIEWTTPQVVRFASTTNSRRTRDLLCYANAWEHSSHSKWLRSSTLRHILSELCIFHSTSSSGRIGTQNGGEWQCGSYCQSLRSILCLH